MTIVGLCFFVVVLFMLACAENECIKPLISCCLCGYDNIDKEKRRRRNLALQQNNVRNEELKEQQRNNPDQYNPSGVPGGPQTFMQGQPQMNNEPYNPAAPPKDPYSNAYPPQPQSQPIQYNQQYNPVQANTTPAQDAQAESGPPIAEKKGFFSKAKDQFNKAVGNKK
eukprot:CAMPEP_0205825540 /NCGR_PEP_ID=MMETSP0206-20130828/25617_1 /ASSEMBLY_ACC=CAM_ASM_000279 /TAXON_ID=36767 /ORGANISM="Euplotes focardii, Strain TN1" /LENGTH=167 /DNA_ID=CAMNT_0053124669 /DNA_START=541 /DNA_END=1044 /DNA_ORIENTATION=+